MKTKTNDIIMQNQVFGYVALITACILSIPLITMQFTNEVQWQPFDFIVMGAILFTMGSLFVLAARKIQDNSNRIVIGIAFFFALLYIWAELAVGIFTNLGS